MSIERLKFRLYDKTQKKYLNDWSDGENVYYISGNGELVCFAWEDGGKDGLHEHEVLIDRDRFVVEQWTGLVDSKGVEIYEGDVLSVTDPNDEKVEDCIVEFKNAWSCYPIEVSMDDFDVTTLGWAKDFGFILTRIGTIHDKAAV